ncbi:MAG TPA: Bax inhibitor-1/YccA family protein [Corynebacterium sp.]|nr:Bax inhibitor-1/YccA family protein [Corynebacterium sp.]
MSSNNPVLTRLVDDGYGRQGYQDPYAGYGQPAPRQSVDRPMTVDDVVTKTGVTLGVVVLFALITFGVALSNVGLALMLTIFGGIAAFITVLVSVFTRKYGSRTVTLLYAAFEGLFLGGFSLLVSGWTVGESNAGSLIGQAILGTMGVFVGMLLVYKTGAIRVTPKFTRFITGAIIGVAVLALGNFLLAIFTPMNPLRDGGTLAIIFSLVCIVLAALSFLQDFDEADKLIRAGAPSQMAWGVALGLTVTLVWLYTEILRLLSYFQRD